MADHPDNSASILNLTEDNMTGSKSVSSKPAEKRTAKNLMDHLLRELDKEDDEITQAQWNVMRKAAGAQVNPHTARMFWIYPRYLEDTDDGLWLDRDVVVSSPGSDELVCWSDLPEARQEIIMKKNPNIKVPIK